MPNTRVPDQPFENSASRKTEGDILEILYKAYPQFVVTAHPGPIQEVRKRAGSGRFGENRHGERLWDEAIGELTNAGHVSVGNAAMGDYALTITPTGIRELTKRRGMSIVEDLNQLNRTVMEATAQLAETIEASKAEQARLDHRVQEVDKRVTSAERDFYSRIVPFFALFVAAFALINAGAQAAVRFPFVSTGNQWADAGWTFLQVGALMLPIMLTVIVLVVATWWVSRPR